MVKAIVCFDLDGTLLQPDHMPATDTVEALEQLRANGSLPVIATGRNRFEVASAIAASGIDSLIAANGAYVQLAGQGVAEHRLDKTLIAKFNAYAAAHNEPVAWYDQDGLALSTTSADTIDNYHALGFDAPVDPDWWREHHVDFMFVFDRRHDRELQQAFAGELAMVRNNPRGLDVATNGVSKATGLRELVAAGGFEGVPTYTFGDAANDLPLFGAVDHPIAMGNGTQAVKDAAEFVTGDFRHGGIAQGLRYYHLI
ncbi:Cof-type HAD-IIB family hydrolase [Lacticaseibacillus sp. GG6-2]